jgi:hypothetical protein
MEEDIRLEQVRMQVEHAMLEMASMVRTCTDKELTDFLSFDGEFGKAIMIDRWTDYNKTERRYRRLKVLNLILKVR